MNVLTRPDLAQSRALFATACRLSRAHSALAGDALRTHGGHGPQISGCVREHFPEPVKDALRTLARAVGAASDAAWRARPPRVRHATMRALSRAVAARDGSGFYGPQA